MAYIVNPYIVQGKIYPRYISNPPRLDPYLSNRPMKHLYIRRHIPYAKKPALEYNPTLNAYIWQDRHLPEVLYNHIYISAQETKYIIPYRFKNKYMKNAYYLILQSLNTQATYSCKYSEFKASKGLVDFPDLFVKNMFGNNCCMGNINIDEIQYTRRTFSWPDATMYYAVWLEFMRRLYDTSHPYYELFNEKYGAAPFRREMTCFSEFYRYFDNMYHFCQDWLWPDPNDMRMYQFHKAKINRKLMYELNKLNSPVPPITYTLKRVRMDERSRVFFRFDGINNLDNYSIDPDKLTNEQRHEAFNSLPHKPVMYHIFERKPWTQERIPGLRALLGES